MPYEITTTAYYEDVISWLQENVGDLLWSRPVVEWRGRGWTMNILGMKRSVHQSYTTYTIRLDDAKLATLAALRWS